MLKELKIYKCELKELTKTDILLLMDRAKREPVVFELELDTAYYRATIVIDDTTTVEEIIKDSSINSGFRERLKKLFLKKEN